MAGSDIFSVEKTSILGCLAIFGGFSLLCFYACKFYSNRSFYGSEVVVALLVAHLGISTLFPRRSENLHNPLPLQWFLSPF